MMVNCYLPLLSQEGNVQTFQNNKLSKKTVIDKVKMEFMIEILKY